MQKHSKTVEPTLRKIEAMWTIDPHSIEAVTKAYAAWFGQAKKMQDETLRFAQDRFEKELAAAVQLTKCTTPNAKSHAARTIWTRRPSFPPISAFSMISSIDAPNSSENSPRILPSNRTKVVNHAAMSVKPVPPQAAGLI